MMSLHGVRSRQPVVGDTIGWWWDRTDSTFETEAFHRNTKKYYQWFILEAQRKRRALLWTLLYIAAEEA